MFFNTIARDWFNKSCLCLHVEFRYLLIYERLFSILKIKEKISLKNLLRLWTFFNVEMQFVIFNLSDFSQTFFQEKRVIAFLRFFVYFIFVSICVLRKNTKYAVWIEFLKNEN